VDAEPRALAEALGRMQFVPAGLQSGGQPVGSLGPLLTLGEFAAQDETLRVMATVQIGEDGFHRRYPGQLWNL